MQGPAAWNRTSRSCVCPVRPATRGPEITMRTPSIPAMRRLVLRVLAVATVSVVAACSTGGAPSTGSPESPVDPTPVIPSPSAEPGAAATYWLRMTTFQAIPPVNLFAVGPTSVITGDGRYLVPGAVPAIYPGPLVMPLFARQVSDAGLEQIVAWADELGLLSGTTDFTGGGTIPGGVTGTIELTVGDRLVALTGLPDAVAPEPEPGSPQAFAELWQRIANLSQALPGELGPETAYEPTAYALLVGPPPVAESGIAPTIADWPLETPLATFGGPVQDGTYRCGLVEGEDAATLRPALEAANQLTMWTQDPETSAAFGLTVRPIVAGENPCAEVFGL